MNKVILIGNLTRDPEYSTTPSGIAVCKFTLAVNRTYTDENGERQADFINVITWRNLADNCAKYLTKGKKASVVGRLQVRSYDNNQGGRSYVTEVIADEVEFLSPQENAAQTPPQPPKKASRPSSYDDLKPTSNDDLPF